MFSTLFRYIKSHLDKSEASKHLLSSPLRTSCRAKEQTDQKTPVTEGKAGKTKQCTDATIDQTFQ